MPKPAFDFGDLDDYLSSDRSPENCMQLSDLDGFLYAIAVGPETIPIEEWLPVVWGGERPKFRNTKEADHVIGAIKARYREIMAGLNQTPAVVSPVFWMKNGYPIVSDWAEGFLDGVKLRLAEWARLVASGDNAMLIPLAVYWVDDDDRPIIHVDDGVRERIDSEATELIPDAVLAIREYWLARATKPGPTDRIH
ncbi:MAG: YecA family protein [Rhodospirillaceae bacterium]